MLGHGRQIPKLSLFEQRIELGQARFKHGLLTKSLLQKRFDPRVQRNRPIE
jgi:hypothetical protein